VTVRSTPILNCCSVSFDDGSEITRRKNSLDTNAVPGQIALPQGRCHPCDDNSAAT